MCVGNIVLMAFAWMTAPGDRIQLVIGDFEDGRAAGQSRQEPDAFETLKRVLAENLGRSLQLDFELVSSIPAKGRNQSDHDQPTNESANSGYLLTGFVTVWNKESVAYNEFGTNLTSTFCQLSVTFQLSDRVTGEVFAKESASVDQKYRRAPSGDIVTRDLTVLLGAQMAQKISKLLKAQRDSARAKQQRLDK